MAKKQMNFSKMGKSEWEAHMADRQKLAAYYEKKGYDSLVELSPQSYIVYVNGRLWDVFREEELSGSDKWMCRDANDPNTYLDPLPTLKACRQAIASMRSGGKVDQVKTEAKEKKTESEKPRYQNYRLLRDLDVEVSEDDDSRANAEIVNWTCGHTILGRQILEINETHVKVQLDYGVAWVPMSGLAVQWKTPSKTTTVDM